MKVAKKIEEGLSYQEYYLEDRMNCEKYKRG
jgi:hypothetical protein